MTFIITRRPVILALNRKTGAAVGRRQINTGAMSTGGSPIANYLPMLYNFLETIIPS
jgi:hypothetical protein